MYEGALPKTGLAVGVGGVALGLSWLLAAAVVLIVAGLLFARYGRGRA